MYKMVLIVSLAACLSVSACSGQQSDWEKTRASNTTDAYELFLKKYPSGEFTAQAQARLKGLYEERDWQKARDLDSSDAYQAFVKQYPEGKWAEEARIRIENFTLAAAPSTASPAGPAASDLPSSAAAGAAPADAPSTPPASKAAHAGASAGASAGSGISATSGGRYAIQLGAFKSGEDAANERWRSLSRKYPKLLGGLSPQVSPRKGTTGTLYRLRVASLSDKHARTICLELKAHSQACEVLRPTQ